MPALVGRAAYHGRRTKLKSRLEKRTNRLWTLMIIGKNHFVEGRKFEVLEEG